MKETVFHSANWMCSYVNGARQKAKTSVFGKHWHEYQNRVRVSKTVFKRERNERDLILTEPFYGEADRIESQLEQLVLDDIQDNLLPDEKLSGLVVQVSGLRRAIQCKNEYGTSEITNESTIRYISIDFIMPNQQSISKRQFLTSSEINISDIINAFAKELSQYNDCNTKSFMDYSPRIDALVMQRATGGILIHETIGHMLEADCFYSPHSLFNKSMGEKIFNESINIIDSGTLRTGISQDRSDDGTVCEDVLLVCNGKLTGSLNDEFHSIKHGVADTGNGRTDFLHFHPLPRMRNTYLAPGPFSASDIVRTTKSGVLVTEVQGGSVNTQNGDYSFKIKNGYKIVNGVVVAPIRPFTVTGNAVNALNSINAIGNDLDHEFNICIKQGQAIAVSYGSPTYRIKAEG